MFVQNRKRVLDYADIFHDASPVPTRDGPRRDKRGRFKTNSESENENSFDSEEKDDDNNTENDYNLTNKDHRHNRDHLRESLRTDLCETAGRMFKQWLGNTFQQKNYILMHVRRIGMQPDRDVLEILMILDDKLLGGANFTADDEDLLIKLYNDHEFRIASNLNLNR